MFQAHRQPAHTDTYSAVTHLARQLERSDPYKAGSLFRVAARFAFERGEMDMSTSFSLLAVHVYQNAMNAHPELEETLLLRAALASKEAGNSERSVDLFLRNVAIVKGNFRRLGPSDTQMTIWIEQSLGNPDRIMVESGIDGARTTDNWVQRELEANIKLYENELYREAAFILKSAGYEKAASELNEHASKVLLGKEFEDLGDLHRET